MEKETVVPYEKQLEMLKALADMKRQVEAGKVEGIIILAARSDGKKVIWHTPMALNEMSACSCLLQAHLLKLWNEPDEEEECED